MSVPDTPKPKAPLLRQESWILLLVGFVFGLGAVVFVPPFVGFDGPNHYLRALQVSEGRARAHVYSERAVGGALPRSHTDFETTILWNFYLRPGHDYLDRRQWELLSSQESQIQGERDVEFTNTAVYSPVNYAFQAAGMALAAGLSPSPLLANWLGCLFNLAGYLLLVVIALECVPRFRRGILLLASSPLIFIQAASLSADPINFALPLLVIVLAWRLRTTDVANPVLEMLVLLLLGILVALLKPVMVAVLICVLFVPARRMGCSVSAKAATLFIYFVVIARVWLEWNGPYVDTDIARWFDPSRPPMEVHRQWLLDYPLRFAKPFLHLLRHDIVSQWPHFYGDPGDWVSAGAYPFNRILSVVFLVGFLACAKWEGATDGQWLAAMAATAYVLLYLMSLTIWMAFGEVRMDFVPGLVGRYFIIPVLAFGIVWAERFHSGLPRLRSDLFWAALVANAAGLAAIIIPVAARTW
ncbi:MAG TPA: DUF2142 domain-containing protein [Opitutaceae bacterium]|jgi:hypothetical protein|nr:DUF2142 domain-containing protein [Opitutaceae bacterium]